MPRIGSPEAVPGCATLFPRMPWIAFLAGLLLGAVGSLLLILFVTVPKLERMVVFRPSRDIFKTPAKLGHAFDQFFIETPDGCRLSAWHLCPQNPVASVIYFHGNGGNLGVLSELLVLFCRYGLRVLAVDYRGYGWSTGTPTEAGLYTDALATVEFFHQHLRGSRPGIPTLYWGRSLGSCVAAYAASRKPPDGLILETGFPSKAALLENFPHLKPFRIFAPCRLETAAYLKEHHFPVLVVHGDRDRTVPFEQGEALYRQLAGPKEFFRVEGADHISVHMIDTEAYFRRVLEFVARVRPAVIH